MPPITPPKSATPKIPTGSSFGLTIVKHIWELSKLFFKASNGVKPDAAKISCLSTNLNLGAKYSTSFYVAIRIWLYSFGCSDIISLPWCVYKIARKMSIIF